MGAPTTSLALVERARAGDQQAFELLFERYRRRLAVLIYYRLPRPAPPLAEVDDLLQETLARAFTALDRFSYREPGSFFRWLARIAERVIADALRYHGRERRRGQPVPLRSESNPAGADPADSHTPSRALAEEQALAALLARLDRLPEDYRQAILLAKIEGLTTAELAERLGRSRQAASLLLHRAIARFRALQGEA